MSKEEDEEKKQRNLAAAAAALAPAFKEPASEQRRPFTEKFTSPNSQHKTLVDEFETYAKSKISNDNNWNLQQTQEAYQEFVKEKVSQNNYVKAQFLATEDGKIDFKEDNGKLYIPYIHPTQPKHIIALYEVKSKEDLTIQDVIIPEQKNLSIICAPYQSSISEVLVKDAIIIASCDRGSDQKHTTITKEGRFRQSSHAESLLKSRAGDHQQHL